MNPNRFTEKAQEAIVTAQQETTRRNNAQFDLEHLLWALLSCARPTPVWPGVTFADAGLARVAGWHTAACCLTAISRKR